MSKGTEPPDTLPGLRERIDAVDGQLLELLSERARLAARVAAVKQAEGGNGSFYRPEREAQVLRGILARNPGPLPDEEVGRLFREVMSACLALEQPLTVAYLGPVGTWTEAAAYKHFGHSVATRSAASIDEVFREVEAGGCAYGVVPVENSIEGVVNHTLDNFADSPLLICGEVELRIHHCLLGQVEALGEARRLYGHPQALAQCRRWVDSYLPGVERVPVSSNAEGARRAAEEAGAVAIASQAAAERYGLRVLAASIEDEPDNTTRFLVIGRHETGPSGQDKTSLLFATPNRPGALKDILDCFSDAGISLSRIESRPSRRAMWEYLFYVDLDGHANEPHVARALAAVETRATLVKRLGSYPQAVL
jgi:chorismate mutase / prephenate dehydratase